jgi:acetyltransferase
VIRVDTVEKLFDYAQAFATQPLPKGKRVGVMSNGGGPAILATDAVEGNGLIMTEFAEETTIELKKVLADLASARNPVDMVSGAGFSHFERVVELLMNDPNTDAVIALFVQPITSNSREVAEAIARAYKMNMHVGKPVLVCFMTRDGDTQGTPVLREAGLPVYVFPESAVQSLAAMNHYREIRERPTGTVRTFDDVDKKRVEKIIAEALAAGQKQPPTEKVIEILRAYKFPTLQVQRVSSRNALAKTADEIGYPLVMKIVAEGITHKSDVGGVHLNLRDAGEVEHAWDEIADAIETLPQKVESWSVTLEPMISGGRELVMGIHSEPLFGPLVMVGMGGIYVEVLKDVAFRLTPVTDADIDYMLKSLRGFPILAGVRGEPSIAFDFVHDMLARLSQLARDFPQIKELDINPLLTFPAAEDCVVVDARLGLDVK